MPQLGGKTSSATVLLYVVACRGSIGATVQSCRVSFFQKWTSKIQLPEIHGGECVTVYGFAQGQSKGGSRRMH